MLCVVRRTSGSLQGGFRVWGLGCWVLRFWFWVLLWVGGEGGRQASLVGSFSDYMAPWVRVRVRDPKT